MNKCIKATIKNSKELDYKELNKILYDIRYKTKLACNKAMTWMYTFTQENMEHKEYTGENIDERTKFGKSHGAWVENRMNEIMDICQSGNVAQTRQFVSNRFQDDKKKGLLKGEVNISNFKKDLPIILHNKSYDINQTDNGYEVVVSLFNMKYQKENNLKRITFVLDKLDGNQKSILNRMTSGEYKKGSAQIIQNRKGKWELMFSFGFEPKIEPLNPNKVLGIDLGITKVATMQVYDSSTGEYDRIDWKECFIDGKELIYYRQKIEARKRQLQIASKIVGEGRIGHGVSTRMKPLEKINDKVSKFRDTYNHKVSKYIIDMAIKYNCGVIQMEDLSGFSEQQSESLLKNWSYYDLQNKVRYKAQEKGIEVNFINPQFTSLRCNKCGCIHKENRDCKNNQSRFECVVCGHGKNGKVNADINAARNIAIPNIDEIIKQQIITQKKFNY